MGDSRLNLTERNQFIYENFHQEDVDNLYKWISADAVTLIANEFSKLRVRYEEGSDGDTPEFAEKIILAAVDECADRIKAEIRFRLSALHDLEKKQKDVEDQLK